MKTAKISVNKTADQPEGVEIEIVQPENPLEERFLGFSVRQLLQAARDGERLGFDLPEGFQVMHQREGSYVIAGFSGKKPAEGEKAEPSYYQPPVPLAVVGLRVVGNQFDLIHAAVDAEQLKAQQQQAAAKPDEKK
ncbi:MAG: hypothetical protein WD294_15420 [Phycisphaeraceae bacterium]